MPVDAIHPIQAKMGPLQTKVRDAIAGEEEIKSKGTVYLPRPTGQTVRDGKDDYPAYLRRALFYGAAGRTVEALVGLIMRKKPIIEFPESKLEMLKIVGVDGSSFDEIIDSMLDELVGPGRVGLLVDAPPETGENEDPYIAEYLGENIVNWETAMVNGRKIPTMIVLREEKEVPKEDDPFIKVIEDQYRVLRLGVPHPVERDDKMQIEEELALLGLTIADFEEGLVYFQEVWIKKTASERDSKDEWELSEVIVPRMFGGRLLYEIPFTPFNADGTNIVPRRPPLLPLVNVNLSHYMNSADLEHGRHFTALPTPYATGVDEQEHGKKEGSDDLVIGSLTAWMLPEADSKVGMLEFTGEGLGHLATGMTEKEKLMAVLGARLLEEQKKGVEAAEAVKLRHAGEKSVLSRISNAGSEGLTHVLRFILDWIADPKPDKASCVLNSDFDLVGLSPEMLAALMVQVQAGLMSWPVYFYNAKRGEIYPEDHTEDEEVKLILEGPPGIEREPTEEDEETDEEKKLREEEEEAERQRKEEEE